MPDGGDRDSGDAGGGEELAMECWSCHGQSGRANPPPDVSGSLDRADPGVGAHEVHLSESDWHATVRCQHCHPVPERGDAPGHIDEQRPADVVFSGLAGAGTDPRREAGSCMVYCHGGALRGDPRWSSEWTSTQAAGCDSCHGLPPGSPHPSSVDCGTCHLEVADASGGIVRASFHIDSVLQAPKHAHLVHLGGAGGRRWDCTSCHQGVLYHGPLKDGKYLEETTICEACHPGGTFGAAQWRGYQWPIDR
jgi:predicted CxxxxCH...CXXCH cytochrome family protein